MYQCQEGKPRAIEIHFYLLPSVRQTRIIEVFFVSKSLRWTSSQGPEEPKNSLVDPEFQTPVVELADCRFFQGPQLEARPLVRVE
jgi:hypothetical protein